MLAAVRKLSHLMKRFSLRGLSYFSACSKPVHSIIRGDQPPQRVQGILVQSLIGPCAGTFCLISKWELPSFFAKLKIVCFSMTKNICHPMLHRTPGPKVSGQNVCSSFAWFKLSLTRTETDVGCSSSNSLGICVQKVSHDWKCQSSKPIFQSNNTIHWPTFDDENYHELRRHFLLTAPW